MPFAPVRKRSSVAVISEKDVKKGGEVYARHCEHCRCTMTSADENPCNILKNRSLREIYDKESLAPSISTGYSQKRGWRSREGCGKLEVLAKRFPSPCLARG